MMTSFTISEIIFSALDDIAGVHELDVKLWGLVPGGGLCGNGAQDIDGVAGGDMQLPT